MVARKIAIALDDSECARDAAKFACNLIARPEDEVHLVAVAAALPAGMGPAAPLATAGAVAAITDHYQRALKEEDRRVREMLKLFKEKVIARPTAEIHALAPAGGASGVAESIVAWAKRLHIDLLVAGSRGMGSTKSTLMSVVGLGSVSAYCLHHLEDTPVCIVQGGTQLDTQPHKKKVLVPVDDSDMARDAQMWAINNVLGPDDELHLISVALPVPYVAGVQLPMGDLSAPAGDFEAEFRGAMEHARATVDAAVAAALAIFKIAADDAAAAHVLEAREIEDAEKNSKEFALETVRSAVQAAAASKVPKERIFFKALEPEGGASDIGTSISHYAAANNIDLLVMGSRGMGAFKRAVMSFVGLGSVSEWCVHNVGRPVIIVRGGGHKQPA